MYKFDKAQLSAEWLTTFDNITNINAYAQHPNGEYLYFGAEYLLDENFESCNSCLTCNCVSDLLLYCMSSYDPYCPYPESIREQFWSPVKYSDIGREPCTDCEVEEDTTYDVPPAQRA